MSRHYCVCFFILSHFFIYLHLHFIDLSYIADYASLYLIDCVWVSATPRSLNSICLILCLKIKEIIIQFAKLFRTSKVLFWIANTTCASLTASIIKHVIKKQGEGQTHIVQRMVMKKFVFPLHIQFPKGVYQIRKQ